MSSTIKLYEHNQKAYDALLDMLGERDRACVIKPTGTGKFVIIAKMVQDNPDKRFLLLGTNDYMFNDQMANLAEIAPGFTPENLQFMTYSAAMMTARRGEEISGYDVVVADEFHHCGAPRRSRVPFFFEQNMRDIWSVRFTCLLVCRSAIFIGSKKGRRKGHRHGLHREDLRTK